MNPAVTGVPQRGTYLLVEIRRSAVPPIVLGPTDQPLLSSPR